MWDQDHDPQHDSASEVPGVIDTIGLAYTRLIARPWIVLGPVLLDLYLWLGLKITAGPLALKAANAVRPVDRIGEPLADFIERQGEFNLAELLSVQLLTIRMPTFLTSLISDQSVRLAGWRPELTDSPWWLLAVMTLLFLAGGYVVGSVFLLAAGDVSRGRPARLSVRKTLVTGYRMVLWVLATAGLLILIAWPLIVAQGVPGSHRIGCCRLLGIPHVSAGRSCVRPLLFFDLRDRPGRRNSGRVVSCELSRSARVWMAVARIYRQLHGRDWRIPILLAAPDHRAAGDAHRNCG